MELKDTVKLMQSSNYIDRFKAEYYQLKIRIEKLKAICDKAKRHELDFELNSPLIFLTAQYNAMNDYLRILKRRAEEEEIDLD